MEIITIKESHYANDLLILKSRLESEGINCFIKDELTSQIMGHIPAVMAMLQISSDDLERAQEIMASVNE